MIWTSVRLMHILSLFLISIHMANWSEFDKGVFLVNVLGIVYNPATKKILIGRRESDPYIKELSWTFPGGRPVYEKELEQYLQEQIKIKTNLDVQVEKIVFAKTYPEKREFLSIYYLCTVASGTEQTSQAKEKFVEIQWVKPTQVKEFFTTSLHPKLFEYLKTLE